MLTGNVQYEAANDAADARTFITGTNTLNQNTATYNFGYQQGFLTGTLLNVTFNNYALDDQQSALELYSPLLQSNFRAQATQHLLQGFGRGINGRFIRAGEERPADYGLGVPAADDLHGDAGGEHLLGAGERVRG